MKDNVNHTLRGLGKVSRKHLATLLRKVKGYITPKALEKYLQITATRAKQLLSYWTKNGWLKRIHRGMYLPIELTAETSDQVLLDPWKLSAERFSPCYIGGWSAAQHWDLTDQIFESTIILTTRHLEKKNWSLGDLRLIVTKIPPNQMFGLQVVWQDGIKVHVSDIHKTIVDMLNTPALAGGIIPFVDFFLKYLSKDNCSPIVLFEYAQKMNNKTIFKRLGFLLEIFKPDSAEIISECLKLMSKGNSQLDPVLKGHSLVKKWRLWIPENLKAAFKKEVL